VVSVRRVKLSIHTTEVIGKWAMPTNPVHTRSYVPMMPSLLHMASQTPALPDFVPMCHLLALHIRAAFQVPHLVRVARARLVPVCARPSAIQQRDTATRLTSAALEQPSPACDERKQPLSTDLPAVRDEEAVGSNPAALTL
jgi:hypothetical protein